MPKTKKRTSRTDRILAIYHMFRFYEEVSMQELRYRFPDFSDKTFSRDIALLKRTGVPIRFSGQRKAFVLADKSNAPDYPESQKERQYLDKIIRLTTMMSNLPDVDCDVWYRGTFPESSKRTMQRDFAALKAVGYEVYYKREWDDPDYKDDEQPPGHYYFDGVYNS